MTSTADVIVTSPRLCWLLTCGSRVTSARCHHLTCGSRVSVPLTCGARSTVNDDRSTVNQVGSRLGFGGPGRGWIWAGPARTHGKLWRYHIVAMGSHWASSTVRPTPCGSRWTHVHGPWTVGWSSVDRVHPLSLLAWLTCTKCRHVRPARGGLYFRPWRAPTDGGLTGVILWWHWRPINVGKSFPRPWRI